MNYVKLAIMTLFAAVLSFSAQAEVKPGDAAPEFQLKSSAAKTLSLADLKGKWVVLEWTNYDCPFVKKLYGSGKMQELQKTYTGKGVVWLQINSSAPGKEGNYPTDEITKRSTDLKTASTAYLIDDDGKVGKAYGARTTPTMVIISPAGKIVYYGAIDSIKSTDLADVPKADNYVQKVLDEVLAGKPATISATQSYGCSVKY